MRLAAIDIGSNAARLLISEVMIRNNGEPEFLKLNLVRVPLRLGFDVFESGQISPEKTEMILQTIKAYKHLLRAYDVKHVKACATSAMRDASNAAEIIKKVKSDTGIEIEVLTGDLEAGMIYENHIAENIQIKIPCNLYLNDIRLYFQTNNLLTTEDLLWAHQAPGMMRR